MSMLTESKKFKDSAKQVLHIRTLAVENQLAEPFTDCTVEGFTGHLSWFIFCYRGEWQVSEGVSHGMKVGMTAVEPMGESKELWEWYWSFVVDICKVVNDVIKNKNQRQIADC